LPAEVGPAAALAQACAIEKPTLVPPPGAIARRRLGEADRTAVRRL